MQVPAQKEAQNNETGRVVLFPTRSSLGKGGPRQKGAGKTDLDQAAVADLQKYERSAEPDDYRRRMVINIVAFAFIVVLTLAGIWLADQLARLNKQQDCVLSGRRNCVELDMQTRGH
jgi:hypothetical protein